MRMPFGKYRGVNLKDIPLDYLQWVVENLDKIGPELMGAIRKEIRSRSEGWEYEDGTDVRAEIRKALAQVRENVRAIVKQWYHGLARDYHPDRGGSNEAMIAINDAYERLMRVLKLDRE